MLLLEQNIIRKKRVNKNVTKLDFKASNSKKYKAKAIQNNVVYANKAHVHLSGFYYLIVKKGYLKEKNTYKLLLAVQYLKKLISCFHKKYLKKLISIFLLIDSVLPIANWPTISANKERYIEF